jgi:cbb3-type cytochrome oxidase maturation protein
VSISYLLVLLGLGVLGGSIWALFWAIDSGQYDDLEAPGRAILESEGENVKPAAAAPIRAVNESGGAHTPPSTE